jgi:hypothetical protein
MKVQVSEQGFDLNTGNGVTELEVFIQRRLCGHVRGFRVLLRDQGVILRGQAHTYYAKQLAQHAVMKAITLPILANEIEVA